MESVLIQSVLNYGVLGLWAAYLIYEKRTTLKALTDHIRENTQVLRELQLAIRYLMKKEKEEAFVKPPKPF
jgi:hypothetical protein